MMRIISVISLLIISSFLIGCKTYQPPTKYQFPNERIVNAGFDGVWQNAVEWFADHNTPIKNIDKSSGLLSTEYRLDTYNNQDCYDCGKSVCNTELRRTLW